MNVAAEGRLMERAVLTVSSQWVYRTTTAVTAIAITPFMVTTLGGQHYGMWAVLLQLVSYAAVFDIGSIVMKLRLASLAGTGLKTEMRREVSAGAIGILLGLPVYLVGATILYVSCRFSFIPCNVFGEDVMVAVWLLLAALIVQKTTSFFSHVLFGMNLEYKRMRLRTVIALICSVADVVVVAIGWGLPGLAANKLVISIATLIVEIRLVRSYVDWFGLAWPGWQHCVRSVRENVVFLMLQGWGSAAVESVEAVLIGYVLGADVVTAYVLTTAPTRQLNNLISGALNGGNAGIGRLFGSGNANKVATLNLQVWCMAAGVVSVGGAVGILFNGSLVRLWVGGIYDLGSATTIAFIVFSGLLIFSRMDQGWLAACLEIRGVAWSQFLSGLFGLVLAAGLVRNHGPFGMLVGLALGRLGAVVWAEHRLARVLRRSRGMWWGMSRAGLCGGGLIAVSATQGARFVEGWVEVVVGMSVAGCLAAAVFWWVGLSAAVRRELMARMGYVVRWGWRSVVASG